MSDQQRHEATSIHPPSTPDTLSADTLSVTWRQTRFELPAARDFPLEALEAEEAGHHLTALRHILGPQQYATWRSLARTAADAEDFSTQVMTELGRGNR